MPLNFPNTWGVKKGWNTQRKTEEEIEEEPEDDKVYDKRTGKMKCPECDNWVDYFAVAEDLVQYGNIDASGDIEYGDTESNGGFSITCPECGNEVFRSSIGRLRDYYADDRR